MRGRPVRELLRQFTPLIAVAALFVVAPAAAAGSPQPDRAPSVTPALAPDPVPGTSAPSRSSQPAVTPVTTAVPTPVTPRAAYVAPAHTSPHAVKHVKVKHAVVRPRHRAVEARPTRYILPRVALPALITGAAANAPRDLDAILAGVALLLAAVTAGSGARLVAVWNRKARAA
jgi:hypothetical protein